MRALGPPALPLSRRSCLLLLVLIALPLLGQSGSLPHTHTGANPGFFNEEHDLTLLATSGAAALPEAAPSLFALVLVALLAAHVAHRPVPAPEGAPACRAPPLA
jgi:hypothetical protein